jgi:hypothetical protein
MEKGAGQLKQRKKAESERKCSHALSHPSVFFDAQGIVQGKEEKKKGHSPAREKVVTIDFSKKK